MSDIRNEYETREANNRSLLAMNMATARSIPVAGTRHTLPRAIRRCLLALAFLIGLSPITTAQTSELDDEAIAKAARDVMQQDDFRPLHERPPNEVEAVEDLDEGFLANLKRRIGESIRDFFNSLFGGGGGGGGGGGSRVSPGRASSGSSGAGTSFAGFFTGLMWVLLIIAVAVVVGLIAWLIVTIVNSHRDPARAPGLEEGEGELVVTAPPGEQPASTYEERAIRLAADGNFRAAVRELLLGCMSWVERSGMIRFRRGLTNRDYIRAVWRQEHRRDAMKSVSLEFERVHFGRRDATQVMFDECLTEFRGHFREEEPATNSVV